MSEPVKTPLPQKPGGDVARAAQTVDLSGLIDRLGMINRIHTALRSTLKFEDIHSIILSSVISRSGLDFSRALIAEYDQTKGVFRGIAALGASSCEDNDRIHSEIKEEEAVLASMVKELNAIEPEVEEQQFFLKSMDDLSNHAFWITTYQKFSNDGKMYEIVRDLELPCPLHPEREANLKATLLGEIVSGHKSHILDRGDLKSAGMPDTLLKLIDEQSIWAPIKTNRDLTLLLMADKIYQDDPIDDMDILHVDWFTGQVSLAVENAQMYNDMELAYKGLRELDRMKSNFLATVSHELRTPLTAINGYVQLLLGNRVGTLSPGQKEVLERILSHSDILTGKVNDLIEIAELDSGRALDLPLEEVDPLNAVMTVLPRVEQRRAHKGITIDPVVESPIPKIKSNHEALERIFFHLIDNGVKFGKTNGIVRIQFNKVQNDLHISISDDGIGMSDSHLQMIFDAFYQIDNQLTRHYEGMGIGLTIIKKQIEITGGRVEVSSELGRGSSFSVIYPLA
jgi:signal transduction histidine kinase